ncbi:MAG TPA: hypothetical protein VL225_21155 [Vicinamibacterales bacterium]|jgi:hypothetical protein|nr:hypothetical protein [Vicinamibacterales bacterium]
MRFLWFLWQFAIFAGGAALLIGAVLAIWYGFSFVVLGLVSKLFRLRPRPPKE